MTKKMTNKTNKMSDKIEITKKNKKYKQNDRQN